MSLIITHGEFSGWEVNETTPTAYLYEAFMELEQSIEVLLAIDKELSRRKDSGDSFLLSLASWNSFDWSKIK